jgi:hypothetical protein
MGKGMAMDRFTPTTDTAPPGAAHENALAVFTQVGMTGKAREADPTADDTRHQNPITTAYFAHVGYDSTTVPIASCPSCTPGPVGASWYRCRSAPQIAVDSTVMMMPLGPGSTGSDTCSTWTSPGPRRSRRASAYATPANYSAGGPNDRLALL